MPALNREISPVVRDTLTMLVVVALGSAVTLRSWLESPPGTPFTVGNAVAIVFYFLWIAGCIVVMLAARRHNRSGWGWFFVSHTFSPLVGALGLWISVARSPGSAPTIGVKKVALAMTGFVVLVGGAFVAWSLMSQSETLTDRLWRECHDTFAFTRPEWTEDRRERMTKRCMEERLLQAR